MVRHKKDQCSKILCLTSNKSQGAAYNFQRRKFPISVSFAMTINKSQEQSLKNVGIYLVTSKQCLKILIVDRDGENANTTSNVINHEVFHNVS
ncbi:hypothetical protein MTR_5g034510 [Medicago truncatula]|uniref:PIF1 helicase n=1 Tax=Medicago truncatula TaxID=3880 RepID=G7K1F5_MEDTR|nr:hypothetical protein MTR_5g034510 [Medicago truncatula]